jgi:RNA polymerase sigma-54 factor
MNRQQSQSQNQHQKQGYYMSHQHLKLMHIMHLSGYALQEYIANEIELNPVLEVEPETEVTDQEEDILKDDEFDSELMWSADDEPAEKNYKQASANEDYYEGQVIHYDSLQEKLKDQIHMMDLSEEITSITNYLIDELDDDGYLRRSVSEVAYDYSFYSGKLIQEEKIEKALSALQKCEPAGIAARDLHECLLLQLNKKKYRTSRIHEIALNLIEKHYQAFVQRQFVTIKAALHISNEELENCIQYISKLNPKPVTETNKYELLKEQIIPDFDVSVEDSGIYVALTSSEFSKLRVNTNYIPANLNISTTSEKKQVVTYFQNLTADANTLVNALKERETTMMNIMTVIVQMQPDFFRSGDIRELKPMILQDIANKTGFDISTVSRITSNKYVQTPYGIFCLKNLFMRAIVSEKGELSSSTSIQVQELIHRIVKEENKLKPL